MDKDSLITQMFNSGLLKITHNDKGFFADMNIDRLALTPRIMNVFVEDLIQKIQNIQAANKTDLKLVALIPESLFLSSMIACALGSDMALFRYRDSYMERHEPDSDYICIGCFLVSGDPLCAAHEKLRAINSRVAHAVYMFNKETFFNKILDYGINVQSSITLSDVVDVYKRKII